MLFGEWPQTIKAADVTVDESVYKVVGAFTYYKGDDGAWYVKQQEKSLYYFFYSDGTKVKEETDNSYRYFKVEPIKWCILTDNYDGKKLLLAENILINCQFYDFDISRYNTTDARSFNNRVNLFIRNNDIYPNNYKESKIRAYLNGLSYIIKDPTSDSQENNNFFMRKGFLQTAFNSEQQSIIANTIIDNSEITTTDANEILPKAAYFICENTIDKIFLLSEQEVTKTEYGFTDYDKNGTGNSRIRKSTDFAKANGAYQSSGTGEGGYWWLRSPCNISQPSGVYSFCSRDVIQNGNSNPTILYSVNRTDGGVCPALCIND
ncbi:MAG: hypothetical protein J6Y60_05685 [Treponema sp.]|nr:hypothetical protein [Treponema sp.]